MRALKILGYLLAAAVLVAGRAVTYLFARQPEMAPAANLKIERTAERLLRAIYAYIRTLPPVTKAVETHPGFDPKVKQLLVSETK